MVNGFGDATFGRLMRNDLRLELGARGLGIGLKGVFVFSFTTLGWGWGLGIFVVMYKS